jgi:plasmid stabilization system protein ParE
MKLVNLTSVQEDLAQGFAFYEEQEPGVGNYFLESLFSDIDALRLYAGIHRSVFGFYRLLSKRFPYAIYYSVENETVSVWAVLDCRQDPERIRERLISLR